MMNGRNDEHETGIDANADIPAPVEASADDVRTLSRRRILRGAAAAPVVLTLASRPALATGGGGGFKCSVSGMGSVSSASTQYRGCYGCGPSEWKKHKSIWYIHHSNKFKQTFGNTIYYFKWPSGGHSNDTIGKCCDAGDGKFHAECVAALLNQLHFPVYPVDDVKSYIESLIGSGWSKWQIKHHLKDLRGTPV